MNCCSFQWLTSAQITENLAFLIHNPLSHSLMHKQKIWLLVITVRSKRLHISFRSTHSEIWKRKCAEIRLAPVTSLQSISCLIHECTITGIIVGSLFFSLPSLTSRQQGYWFSYEWNGCKNLELKGCVPATNLKMLIFQFRILFFWMTLSWVARTVSLLSCNCSPCGIADKEDRVAKGSLYI